MRTVLPYLLVMFITVSMFCGDCVGGKNWDNSISAIEITPYDEKQDAEIVKTKESQINYALSDSILAKELETKMRIYEAIIGALAIAALSLAVWVFKNHYRGGNSQ